MIHQCAHTKQGQHLVGMDVKVFKEYHANY